MMRAFYIFIFTMLASCAMDESYGDLYTLQSLTIDVSYPEEYSEYDLEGANVTIKDIDRGNSYATTLDGEGSSTIVLTNGRYIVQYSNSHINEQEGGVDIFNATADQVLIADSDITLTLSPSRSTSAALVIKEIYCGGCMRTPEEGTYQYDKYITIHNNSAETVYLDGLCYGVLDPYNSQASNVWVESDPVTGATIYPDELYFIQAVWQIGGDGDDFPLAPGEDAVIANSGAIDHRAQYPLSVNLNKADYFVLYDNVYFYNTYYHPAPGDQISPDRYLDVVIKLGVANGWTFSVYSPAPAIFRPIGCTIEEYIAQDGSVISKIGSTVDKVLRVPLEWILDGVEVFYGGSSNNTKRFNPFVDAGYVYQSEIYDGKTLHRKVDEEASAAAGYEILVDTNNSTNDFYEREEASLRDE